ncbi:MAG: hypothetical protein Q9183_004559 [Haloplaca sp. 2 TL-2023]
MSLPRSSIPSMQEVAEQMKLEYDTETVLSYLQNFYLMRYQHPSCVSEYRPRLDADRVRPLGYWLFHITTGQYYFLRKLADFHRIGCRQVTEQYERRMERLLRSIRIDPKYLAFRLTAVDNPYALASAYNVLANDLEWDELASQFCYDRDIFDIVFPGEIEHACPERGIATSNAKAAAETGMSLLHKQFFSKLQNPKNYKLSKYAKGIEKTVREQQRYDSKTASTETVNSASPFLPSSRHRAWTSCVRRTARKWGEKAKFELEFAAEDLAFQLGRFCTLDF